MGERDQRNETDHPVRSGSAGEAGHPAVASPGRSKAERLPWGQDQNRPLKPARGRKVESFQALRLVGPVVVGEVEIVVDVGFEAPPWSRARLDGRERR